LRLISSTSPYLTPSIGVPPYIRSARRFSLPKLFMPLLALGQLALPVRRSLNSLWRLGGEIAHRGLGAILGLLATVEAPCSRRGIPIAVATG
jgi:hypothetical protein